MHPLDQYHEIGEVIKYGSMNLQVVESDTCYGCKFDFCNYSFCKTKACSHDKRKDKKNIIFKEVRYEKK